MLTRSGIRAHVLPDRCDPAIALISARKPFWLDHGSAIPCSGVRRQDSCGTPSAPDRLSSTVTLRATTSWVDETTPAAPSDGRSQVRAAVEQAWLAFGAISGIAVHIFRLSGIYGPGRNQLAQLAAGTARRIVKPGQVFNRIHVADIAAVIEASLRQPRAGAIYNVSDDEPGERGRRRRG
jgi:hypothetical protein